MRAPTNDDGLTEQEEMYSQARASGQTKTGAARIAYAKSANSKQMGYEVEKRERVKDRIQELKEERAEAAGLDFNEQLRRYNEIYNLLMEKGNLIQASKILERIDSLGGFEAATKSISMKVGAKDSLKDHTGDLAKDLEKFSSVLTKHTEEPKETPTKDGTLH